MSFTFTINGHEYTSDPANVTALDGYRFIGYGYISALANLAQDIVTDMAARQAAAASANGVLAITYTFDTTTTDADPGAGKLRLGNATQNAATTIRVDLLDSLGVDWTSVLDTFDASTNTVKGQIRLSKVSDGSKWLTFNVTAKASPAGYRNFTVTNTGYSAASPFANGDSILLSFTRTGDKGAQGDPGPAGASAATQAEMEAASSNTVMATPANTQWHPGVAKAWIKCDKFGGIQASHNVTSITDVGTGVVDVTIATDFSSANYAVVGTHVGSANYDISVSNQAAGSFRGISFNGPSSTNADPDNYFFVCYGDQ